MNYIFQRIILNDYQWLRPSPRRLGKNGEGEYVKKHGFGHEDWNFNAELEIDGYIYGYLYYKPSEKKIGEKYNIIFATYLNKKWFLAGIYKDAEYVDDPPSSEFVINQKISDLLSIKDYLGKMLNNKKSIKNEIKESSNWLRWKVKPENIIRTVAPIEIPKNYFHTSNYRIVRPTILSEDTYLSILTLLEKESDHIQSEEETEFPEGKLIENKHKRRERNPTIIRLAKDKYKKINKDLECQVCGFSFRKKYGEIGIDFIEAHHIIPGSELDSNSKTKIEDISFVCSNCHRMLHRKRPWLKLKDLKKLLK